MKKFLISAICAIGLYSATAACNNLLKLNRKTINKYYNEFRLKILESSLKEQEKEFGGFELDESYFGAKRIRGKRGRGAAGKTPVLGLLKRDGKVFVKVVPNCSREELMSIIQGKILEGFTIHTDGWKAYDGLIQISSFLVFNIIRISGYNYSV